MPTNIEIKAWVRNLDALTAKVAELADGPEEVLDQVDTFFAVKQGRLKVRRMGPGKGELIHYQRPDRKGPKPSDYEVLSVTEPDRLCALLGQALGVVERVSKRRRLFFCGQTRIHLDEVVGLGSFLELEVVLRQGQSPDEGFEVANRLMTTLQIEPADLVEGAYVDLVTRPDRPPS